MHPYSRVVGVVGVACLVAGVCVAFSLRNDDGAIRLVPVALTLLGALLVAGVLVDMVRGESRPNGLQVPEAYALQLAARPGLPAPSWWGPAALTAGSVAVAGAYVSPLLAGLGLGLLLAALAAGVAESARLVRIKSARSAAGGEAGPAPLDRESVRLARRLQSFGRRHAVPGEDGTPEEGVDAVLEHVGRYGVKIVLVGADGRVGDQLARDLPRAQLACELAGVRLAETFSRELTGKMHNTRYEWQRMGASNPGPIRDRKVVGDKVQVAEGPASPGGDDEVATGDAQPSVRAGA
jgi:hypothetical protein